MVTWFDLGGEIKLTDSNNSKQLFQELKNIQGLLDKLGALGIKPKDADEVQVSGAEFILEGLYAHKKIGQPIDPQLQPRIVNHPPPFRKRLPKTQSHPSSSNFQ